MLPPSTSLNCTPELTEFIAIRDRAARIQAEFDAALAKLKALDAAELAARHQRRPTLIGVAPATARRSEVSSAITAAALGRRPNGRY